MNHAWRAWLAYNFIDVDKRGDVYEPHDGGGGFYEEVYGYSASRYCYALDLMGYPAEARTIPRFHSHVRQTGRFAHRKLRFAGYRRAALGHGAPLPNHPQRPVAPEGRADDDQDVRLDHCHPESQHGPAGQGRTLVWLDQVQALLR